MDQRINLVWLGTTVVRYHRLISTLVCILLAGSASCPIDAGDRAPRTTLDVTDITPKPGEHVSESTTIKATLQFEIVKFAAPPDKYTASLMFDNPMGGSGYFDDFGCQGATHTVTTASGTVTLECRLSEVWAKFKHSRRMGVTFVITHLKGSRGTGIAQSESIQYDIDR